MIPQDSSSGRRQFSQCAKNSAFPPIQSHLKIWRHLSHSPYACISIPLLTSVLLPRVKHCVSQQVNISPHIHHGRGRLIVSLVIITACLTELSIRVIITVVKIRAHQPHLMYNQRTNRAYRFCHPVNRNTFHLLHLTHCISIHLKLEASIQKSSPLLETGHNGSEKSRAKNTGVWWIMH